MTQSDQAREVARRLGVASHPDTALIAEAVAVFAPLGWAMCGRWHRDGTLRALRLAGEDATEEAIDEAITEVWNNDNKTWLHHAATPIRQWSNSHYPFKQLLWDRVVLIEKAIEHHFAGAYEASIPIVLAQIDGMSIDVTGKSFFSKKNNDPYMDDETLAGMEANLPVVRGVFSEDVRPSGHYGRVSRHGVMHGRDLAYATRANSTKAIVLVAALAEYLPKIADDVGARYRQDHENEVAGSTEVDEVGRLIDDREVPELHRFAYDLDSAYLESVLLNRGPFDVRAQLTAVARKHSFDPTGFTVEHDSIGWRWHYTLPAGQTLGYAARPSTSSERKHPDVWRWDAAAEPAALPWENPDGWRSDDDFPRSSNWEPKLVI